MAPTRCYHYDEDGNPWRRGCTSKQCKFVHPDHDDWDTARASNIEVPSWVYGGNKKNKNKNQDAPEYRDDDEDEGGYDELSGDDGDEDADEADEADDGQHSAANSYHSNGSKKPWWRKNYVVRGGKTFRGRGRGRGQVRGRGRGRGRGGYNSDKQDTADGDGGEDGWTDTTTGDGDGDEGTTGVGAAATNANTVVPNLDLLLRLAPRSTSTEAEALARRRGRGKDSRSHRRTPSPPPPSYRRDQPSSRFSPPSYPLSQRLRSTSPPPPRRRSLSTAHHTRGVSDSRVGALPPSPAYKPEPSSELMPPPPPPSSGSKHTFQTQQTMRAASSSHAITEKKPRGIAPYRLAQEKLRQEHIKLWDERIKLLSSSGTVWETLKTLKGELAVGTAVTQNTFLDNLDDTEKARIKGEQATLCARMDSESALFRELRTQLELSGLPSKNPVDVNPLYSSSPYANIMRDVHRQIHEHAINLISKFVGMKSSLREIEAALERRAERERERERAAQEKSGIGKRKRGLPSSNLEDAEVDDYVPSMEEFQALRELLMRYEGQMSEVIGDITNWESNRNEVTVSILEVKLDSVRDERAAVAQSMVEVYQKERAEVKAELKEGFMHVGRQVINLDEQVGEVAGALARLVPQADTLEASAKDERTHGDEARTRVQQIQENLKAYIDLQARNASAMGTLRVAIDAYVNRPASPSPPPPSSSPKVYPESEDIAQSLAPVIIDAASERLEHVRGDIKNMLSWNDIEAAQNLDACSARLLAILEELERKAAEVSQPTADLEQESLVDDGGDEATQESAHHTSDDLTPEVPGPPANLEVNDAAEPLVTETQGGPQEKLSSVPIGDPPATQEHIPADSEPEPPAQILNSADEDLGRVPSPVPPDDSAGPIINPENDNAITIAVSPPCTPPVALQDPPSPTPLVSPYVSGADIPISLSHSVRSASPASLRYTPPPVAITPIQVDDSPPISPVLPRPTSPTILVTETQGGPQEKLPSDPIGDPPAAQEHVPADPEPEPPSQLLMSAGWGVARTTSPVPLNDQTTPIINLENDNDIATFVSPLRTLPVPLQDPPSPTPFEVPHVSVPEIPVPLSPSVRSASPASLRYTPLPEVITPILVEDNQPISPVVPRRTSPTTAPGETDDAPSRASPKSLSPYVADTLPPKDASPVPVIKAEPTDADLAPVKPQHDCSFLTDPSMEGLLVKLEPIKKKVYKPFIFHKIIAPSENNGKAMLEVQDWGKGRNNPKYRQFLLEDMCYVPPTGRRQTVIWTTPGQDHCQKYYVIQYRKELCLVCKHPKVQTSHGFCVDTASLAQLAKHYTTQARPSAQTVSVRTKAASTPRIPQAAPTSTPTTATPISATTATTRTKAKNTAISTTVAIHTPHDYSHSLAQSTQTFRVIARNTPLSLPSKTAHAPAPIFSGRVEAQHTMLKFHFSHPAPYWLKEPEFTGHHIQFKEQDGDGSIFEFVRISGSVVVVQKLVEIFSLRTFPLEKIRHVIPHNSFQLVVPITGNYKGVVSRVIVYGEDQCTVAKGHRFDRTVTTLCQTVDLAVVFVAAQNVR